MRHPVFLFVFFVLLAVLLAAVSRGVRVVPRGTDHPMVYAAVVGALAALAWAVEWLVQEAA